MKWFRRKHRCMLPPTPEPYVEVDETDTVTCEECGKRWALYWSEDIVEYTIGTYADIGSWHWVET
jgi:hypothetical protein